MGTESDPHFVHPASAGDQDLKSGVDLLDVGGAGMDRGQENGPKHSKPGRLRYEMAWDAEGKQVLQCHLDRVKLFIRPN